MKRLYGGEAVAHAEENGVFIHVCSDRSPPRKLTRILAIAALLLPACTNTTPDYAPESSPSVTFSADSLATYVLDSRTFTFSDSLGRPSTIAVGNDYVYIGDNNAPRALLVFDRSTGDLANMTGRFGEGPREIAYLWSLDFKPGQENGWLYELRRRTMHFFNGDSLTDKTILLTGQATAMSPARVAGDSIASTGLYNQGRLAVYGPDGILTSYKGPTPPGDPDVPIPVRQHAYEAEIKTNSTGSRIVVASKHSDRIEIFDSGGLRHLVRGPQIHEPKYTTHRNEEGDSWLSINDESVFAYVSVAVTDDRVFILYSGMTMGEVKQKRWWSPPGNRIIAFTWTGEPLAVLEIMQGAIAIAVSADGRDLYAIYHRPAPMIMHYEVPDLLGLATV